MLKKIFYFTCIVVVLFFAHFIYKAIVRKGQENEILKKVVSRLEAETRLAEVLVTGVKFDEKTKKNFTTIKFLEYDSRQKPLTPRYFTFSGNIIQFQSLVIRFDDVLVKGGDRLRGKSAYIFWKVFMLDNGNTKEYDISKINEIPAGYKVEGIEDPYEEKLWNNFWASALDPETSKMNGIKNAQIEAPGTMFVPGNLYTIKIEHDGGLRIDVSPIPSILKGEKILE